MVLAVCTAGQTAEIITAAAGLPIPAVDERLRDRELGILDLLTTQGVEARFPGEAQRRKWLGKLYTGHLVANPGPTWRCG